MVLDRRRPDNQKTLGDQIEEERVEYEQMNGAGERTDIWMRSER